MEVFDDFGNYDLLSRRKTAFVCSHLVPVEYSTRMIDWANGVTHDECIICGRSTSMERQVSDILLQRGIPFIWVAINNDEVKSEIDQLRPYIIQDRMLVLSLFPPESTLSRSQRSFMRNMAVIEHADQIVCGYCTPDGTLDHQLASCGDVHHLVTNNEPHRHVDFLKLESGPLSLETLDNQLRIVQRRSTLQESIVQEVIQLTSTDVIRLRNALDRAIEVNNWGDSRHDELRQTYPNAFRPWNAEDELVLRQLAQEGRSDEEIGQLLGRQPSAVSSRLQLLLQRESSIDPNP